MQARKKKRKKKKCFGGLVTYEPSLGKGRTEERGFDQEKLQEGKRENGPSGGRLENRKRGGGGHLFLGGALRGRGEGKAPAGRHGTVSRPVSLCQS